MSAESERKLSIAARSNAVDEQAPINRALTQVVDRHVSRLKAEVAMGHLVDEDGDGEVDEVPFNEQYVTVIFPEIGEELVVRITKAHTFDQLVGDACRHVAMPDCPFPKVVAYRAHKHRFYGPTCRVCRYFGRPSHRDRLELVDDTGAAWSPQLAVRQEVAQARPSATVYSSVPI